MAYTIACRDLGAACPYIARNETIDEVVQDAMKHAKEVHNYTDEQLNDPKMIEETKALVKEV